MKRTESPEFTAMLSILQRNEILQKLSVDLLRQEKITHKFLRRFMEETLDAWFDLEEKTTSALNRMTILMEELSEAKRMAIVAKEGAEYFAQKILPLEQKIDRS